jgi:hypothetical protein
MILVTEATSNDGRPLVSQPRDMCAAGRGFARDPHSGGLPGKVDVMRTELAVPGTPDAYVHRVEAVFLVWPFAPAILYAATKHTPRIVYLSSEGVGYNLEQQTDMTTAGSATKLAA